MIYVEANYFVTTVATTNFTDGNYGGRVVIRFNRTQGPSITAFEYHSPQGQNRGFQRWETYNNAIVDMTAHVFSACRSRRDGCVQQLGSPGATDRFSTTCEAGRILALRRIEQPGSEHGGGVAMSDQIGRRIFAMNHADGVESETEAAIWGKYARRMSRS